MKFLAGRLIRSGFLLVGVSLLSFLLMQLAPGDFFEEMKLNPQISPQTIAGLRAQFGLDRSLPVRYGLWLQSAVHGDFGYSFAYNSPVAPLLKTRVRNTALLAGISTAIAWLLALAIGIWSAMRAGHWDDRLCTGVMSISMAVPDVLIALALLLLAARTGVFPVGGMVSTNFDDLTFLQKAKDIGAHMALPVLALVFGLAPTLVRHVRSSVAQALSAPCVQAARAHGIGRARLLFRHVLPVAANPLISLFGVSLATLLSISLLIEVIMSWPGLGPFFLEAILARDVYVVIGTVLLSTVFLAAGNLIADGLLFAADPRIRRP
jgi:peptide/nickel transport system permease protein